MTIYKGMFEFMVLQCIAIVVVMFFPPIATWFPERLQHQARQVQTQDVDDSANTLEPEGGYGSELRDALEGKGKEGDAEPDAEPEAEAEEQPKKE